MWTIELNWSIELDPWTLGILVPLKTQHANKSLKLEIAHMTFLPNCNRIAMRLGESLHLTEMLWNNPRDTAIARHSERLSLSFHCAQATHVQPQTTKTWPPDTLARTSDSEATTCPSAKKDFANGRNLAANSPRTPDSSSLSSSQRGASAAKAPIFLGSRALAVCCAVCLR